MARLGPALGLALAAPLLATATAHAQAPGQVDPTTAPAPVVDPTPVVVAPPAYLDVLAHRFSVGLDLAAWSVADENDTTEADFRGADLALRFRMTPRLEAELVLSGGRQVLDDGEDGELAMGGGTLGLRYRFLPGRPWDFWLGAGLGATVIERHDSTSDERDAANRPHAALSLGVERRWRRFAIHADVRMVALGARNDQLDMAAPPPQVDGEPVPDLPPQPAPDLRTAESLSAGVFSLGASFYF